LLDLFPNTFLDSPLFFSDDEKDLLTGSTIIEDIKEVIEAIEYNFRIL